MSTLRPVLHHAPSSGWVNDPLALTFHEGRYHLFFQYVAGRTTQSHGCAWGHATSSDLLTWETRPVSLEPDDDEDGVWSGSLVKAPDAVVFYTAVDAGDVDQGRVRRALPDDNTWTTWRKEDVVVTPPADADVRAFRDPYVAPYDGETGSGWRMLVGGGLDDGSGALWTSRSADLVSWSPPLLAASGTEVGSLWECPVLLEVDGRTVVVISVGGPEEQHGVAYAWCESDDGDRLGLSQWQRLTSGTGLYAASGFTDADGRPGLIAWLRNVGDEEAGWMGAHSLPYLLTVSGDRLVAGPHPAVLERRTGRVMVGLLPAVADVEWDARPGDVLVADGRFRLDAVGKVLAVTVGEDRHELPWAGDTLRLVLDGPVLEVFGEGGVLAVPVPATGRDGVLAGDLARVSVHRLTGG